MYKLNAIKKEISKFVACTYHIATVPENKCVKLVDHARLKATTVAGHGKVFPSLCTVCGPAVTLHGFFQVLEERQC